MDNYREDIVSIELESGNVHRSFLNHAIGGGDEKANRFGVRLFRNGEPEAINGSCVGYFIPYGSNDAMVINGGSCVGNVGYVTLPEACYAIEGNFTLAIKVVGTNASGTMRIIDGTVVRTGTEVIYDPGDAIPTLESLLAVIEDAEDVADRIADFTIYAELIDGDDYRIVAENNMTPAVTT